MAKEDNIERIQFFGYEQQTQSVFPVLLYKAMLDIPFLFPSLRIKQKIGGNGWKTPDNFIPFQFHHFHSEAHIAVAVYSGKTLLQLGGNAGPKIRLEKGDLAVIPSGMLLRFLECIHFKCVGGFYNNVHNDNCNHENGKARKATVYPTSCSVPDNDPVLGAGNGIVPIWREFFKKQHPNICNDKLS